METTGNKVLSNDRSFWHKIYLMFSQVPLMGWLLGALIAVALEQFVGTPFARAIGLTKAPSLFGLVIML